MGEARLMSVRIASTLPAPLVLPPGPQVVTPSYERLVKNEGMPVSKHPGQKGNLRVRFEIQWPKRQLSESEGQQLHRMLADKY